MEKNYRLVYRNRDLAKIVERIDRKIETTVSHRAILNESSVLENVFSDRFIEVQSADGTMLSENEKKNFLNIVRKSAYAFRYSEFNVLFRYASKIRELALSKADYTGYIQNMLSSFEYRISQDATENYTNSKKTEEFLEWMSKKTDKYAHKKGYMAFINSIYRGVIMEEFELNHEDLYTLEDLYKIRNKNTNERLINHAMKLLYVKREAFEKLLMNGFSRSKDPRSSLHQNTEYYDITEENLKILLSIIKYKKEIREEISLYEDVSDMAKIVNSWPSVLDEKSDNLFKTIKNNEKKLEELNKNRITSLEEKFNRSNEKLKKIYKEQEEENGQTHINQFHVEQLQNEYTISYQKYKKQLKYDKVIKNARKIKSRIDSLSTDQKEYIKEKIREEYAESAEAAVSRKMKALKMEIHPIYRVSQTRVKNISIGISIVAFFLFAGYVFQKYVAQPVN